MHWGTDSWKSFPILQNIPYNQNHLNVVLNKLSKLPPLVSVEEINDLNSEIDTGFILQCGDCAETFANCNPNYISNQIQIMKKMSLIINKKVIPIYRLAGQYAKPRSMEKETLNGNSVLTYRGDAVNSFSCRNPDPERLLTAYFHAAATLNYARSLGKIYTSHEGLLLDFESCFTRKIGEKYFNLGTHFPWIGDRTRKIDYAHVEYFRGISNPIGVKISSSISGPELIALCDKFDSCRIVLICRYGIDKIEQCLPTHIKAIQKSNIKVIWCCDPMHGNTKLLGSYKTRYLDDVLLEIKLSFQIHSKLNSTLNGVHLEVSGDDVTECIGENVTENDLNANYTSFCDPRLNKQQALVVAKAISQQL